MIIETIRCKRVIQVRQYEPIELEATASVFEGENVTEAGKSLSNFVEAATRLAVNEGRRRDGQESAQNKAAQVKAAEPTAESDDPFADE